MGPFTLLHLSDLHFGPHCRFAGQDMNVLAASVAQAVADACRTHDLGAAIDLVVVTGDIAEAARPREYKEAAAFFAALTKALGLAPARFVFAPGNHDVSWSRCRRVYDDYDDGTLPDEAERDRRVHIDKYEHFEAFAVDFYGKPRGQVAGVSALEPLEQGAFVHEIPELGVSVAVVNSCERETHLVHGGQIGEAQAQALMRHFRDQGEARAPVRIVALHHNPVATVPENIDGSLRRLLDRVQTGTLDPQVIEHFKADAYGLHGREHLRAVATDCQVQLVLHGHHHASVREDAWMWRSGPGQTAVLSAGSWGLVDNHLPADEPVAMHLVRIDPAAAAMRSLLLRYEPGLRQVGRVLPGTFAPAPDGVARLLLALPPAGKRLRQDEPKEQSADVDMSLIDAYRRAFRGAMNHWDLAVGAHHTGVRPPGDMPGLDDMYQPLRLVRDDSNEWFARRHAAPDKEDDGQDKSESKDGEAETPGAVLEPNMLIAASRSLVVRGPAGAGKTTWLRWTFRRLMEPERYAAVLPLFIELRALARIWETQPDGARTLGDYLAKRLTATMGPGFGPRLDAAVPAWLAASRGPRPILLIDGWDEAGPLGRDLREKLMALLALHPRVLAVVTSRPYGQDPPTAGDGFDIFDIQPLNDGDITALSARFYTKVHGNIGPAAAEARDRFLSALAAAPAARDMAGSPLLLTMMLALHRSRPLPNRRHLLYRACIDTLLADRPDHKQDEGAKSGRHTYRPDDYDDRKRAVQALAHGMKTGAGGGMRMLGGIIAVTADAAARHLPADWDDRMRLGFLRWLVEVAGLLVDRTDDTLVFAHLSFQEYLTACHLVDAADGGAARLELCRTYAPDRRWWETLRLWAAELHGRNPDHLTPVLEALVSGAIVADALPGSFQEAREQRRTQAAGFWLAGAMFADETGNSEAFTAWIRGLHRCFHELGRDWAHLTAIAWNGTHHARKQRLSEEWPAIMADASWVAWMRAESWRPRGGIKTQAAPGWRAAPVLRALDAREISDPVELALGRVWCGNTPWWPAQSRPISLLRLWPGMRPALGMRLQCLASLGVPRALLTQVLGAMMRQRDRHEEQARKFARHLALHLARQGAGEFAQDFAQDLARCLGRDVGQEVGREIGRDLARYLTTHLVLESTQYRSESVSGSVREQARLLAGYFVRSRAWDDLVMGFASFLARDFVHSFAFPPDAPWLIDAATLELVSADGRAALRAAAAHTDAQGDPLLRLFGPACRISLGKTVDTPELAKVRRARSIAGDSLWPALARHVARCGRPKDEALLAHLARHPEEREAPLSWGLQFYVRGDIVLLDGTKPTVVTLDELCAEAGIEPLPVLEPMPDELDISYK